MSKGLGVAMAGSTMSSTARKRHDLDFYPAPPPITKGLLLSGYAPSKKSPVHECACGDMAMSNVLIEAGYSVLSTDIRSGTDFLEMEKPLAPQIVTNPPFSLASEFIEKAYGLNVEYLALLLKMTFWSAARRSELFSRCRPLAVLPLTWRMDVTGQGNPTMEVAWYVWHPQRKRDTYTDFEPILKPEE